MYPAIEERHERNVTLTERREKPANTFKNFSANNPNSSRVIALNNGLGATLWWRG